MWVSCIFTNINFNFENTWWYKIKSFVPAHFIKHVTVSETFFFFSLNGERTQSERWTPFCERWTNGAQTERWTQDDIICIRNVSDFARGLYLFHNQLRKQIRIFNQGINDKYKPESENGMFYSSEYIQSKQSIVYFCISAECIFLMKYSKPNFHICSITCTYTCMHTCMYIEM